MNSLLVPVDFSPNAADALRYAVELARHASYTLDCLNVTAIHTRSHFLSEAQLNQLELQERNKALERLRSFLQQELPADNLPTIRPIVRVGFAIEEIIAQATGMEYAALVMGTKGMEGLGDKILGSNTANVMENVLQPVISVPLGGRYTQLEELTYVCNIEAISLPCMGRLFDLAQRMGAKLHLLHVDELGAYRRPGMREQLEHLVHLAIGNQLVLVTVLEAESITDGVVVFLQQHKRDLIAISLQDQSAFRKLFRRSIDEKLRQQLQIPILTLKS